MREDEMTEMFPVGFVEQKRSGLCPCGGEARPGQGYCLECHKAAQKRYLARAQGGHRAHLAHACGRWGHRCCWLDVVTSLDLLCAGERPGRRGCRTDKDGVLFRIKEGAKMKLLKIGFDHD
jgi:hypothetical protein